jgi:uncharacterized membrane protein HdeD (DUF308 family)
MELLGQRLEDVAKHWRWFVVIGIVMIISGFLAIYATPVATLTVVAVLGLLLMVAGLAQALFAIRITPWLGFFTMLLSGLLSMVVGYLFVTHPAISAVSLTLLLAVYFLVSGLFRILTAVVQRFSHWGWALASGIITLFLGVLVWSEWPISGFWIIGLFVGIDLIFAGTTTIATGIGLHQLIPDTRGRAAL